MRKYTFLLTLFLGMVIAGITFLLLFIERPKSISMDYKIVDKVHDTANGNYVVILRNIDSTGLSFVKGSPFWDSCKVKDILSVKYKIKK